MKLLAIIAGIVGTAFVIYHLLFPTYTHRYRLTIEVEVDGKVRSASSVIEVRIQDQRGIPLVRGAYNAKVSGEAVFLDLGNGQHVIAILGFGRTGQEHPLNVSTLARNVFNPLPNNRGLESLKLMPSLPIQKKAKLHGQQIPTMVTFGDLSNPTTARIVPVSEFSRVFGPNIRFRAAWIEITNDSVTRGIKKKLPWLPHPTYITGKKLCDPRDPHCLHGGNFER